MSAPEGSSTAEEVSHVTPVRATDGEDWMMPTLPDSQAARTWGIAEFLVLNYWCWVELEEHRVAGRDVALGRRRHPDDLERLQKDLHDKIKAVVSFGPDDDDKPLGRLGAMFLLWLLFDMELQQGRSG